MVLRLREGPPGPSGAGGGLVPGSRPWNLARGFDSPAVHDYGVVVHVPSDEYNGSPLRAVWGLTPLANFIGREWLVCKPTPTGLRGQHPHPLRVGQLVQRAKEVVARGGGAGALG